MIDVIIPTIGKDKFIINLILQLIEQKHYNKISVFDNGCDLNVLKELNQYQIEVLDAHNLKLYTMWNIGIKRSKADYVAVLNDDVILGEDFLRQLAYPFSEDENIWVTCPNYDNRFFEEPYKFFPGTFKSGGLCGFAFMLRRDAFNKYLPYFDENYNWWYGDDDLYHNVVKLNKKAVMVRTVTIEHINGGSNSIDAYSPEFNAMVELDKQYYMRRWYSA